MASSRSGGKSSVNEDIELAHVNKVKEKEPLSSRRNKKKPDVNVESDRKSASRHQSKDDGLEILVIRIQIGQRIIKLF